MFTFLIIKDITNMEEDYKLQWQILKFCNEKDVLE